MKSVYTDHYQKFLGLIIEARNTAGWTQQKLADQLKKPQSYVSKYESGERRLDIVEFLLIAAHLSIDPCIFLKNLGVGHRTKRKGRS